jgi:predicted nuclease with RNAse H fold
MAVFLGIDLAGSPRRPTGIALLDEKLRCRTWVRYLDEEILVDVDSFKPLVVGVDAPLGLPRGRESLESRGPPHFRECDLELRRRGIRFFPITIGAMRALTERVSAYQNFCAAKATRSSKHIRAVCRMSSDCHANRKAYPGSSGG